MATLKLKNVNKIYPNGAHAVIDFNLEIEDKDFVVLVGPSGCGKSTTLRMIAGLEDISSGEIYIDDTLVNELEPKDREIAMVFQSYALYPHLSVFENLAYGLKIKKTPIREIEDKVVKTAKVLDLLELLDRKPAELSGGQRQRVALGRAIIRDAKVFLMDEPLSNLDAKLRVQTRSELINLHRELGNTTIYVTHDQVEAMTMATKIVVMSEGLVEQVGEPELLYNYPNNTFVGGFIGTPPMNFVKTRVCKNGYVNIFDCKIKVADEKIDIIEENDMYDKDIILGIRPEDIHEATVDKNYKDDSCMKSKVVFSEILGSETNIYYNLNGSEVISKIEDAKDFKVGEEVKIFLDMKKAHFFDVESGNRLSSVKEEEARNNLIKILRK